MLRSIKFTNFKTWPQAEVEFRRVTGFFGKNSSGKTSLLQFLLLLKQTKDATDRGVSLDLNGPYASLGVFKDVIRGHDDKETIQWDLRFSRQSRLSLINPGSRRTRYLAQSHRLRISGAVESRSGAPFSSRLRYTVGDGATFGLRQKSSGESAFELYSRLEDFSFVRTKGRPWQLPGPIKSYAFPDQARTYFQNASFLSDLEAAFEAQMDSIFYLGPLREYPQRDYLWARSRPVDVGLRGEKTIDAILAATAAKATRNLKSKAHHKSFQEMIAYWLERMGLIQSFKVEEIAPGSNRWQAKVRVRKGGTEVMMTDVGFGVSQVLPVITLLYYVPEGSTVILEQPEIHLHPLAQAELADVILSVAQHRSVQIVLESHSEHLLLRLQRRIAEDRAKSDDVSLYFCTDRNGASVLDDLSMDLFGRIENWPDQFMGDAFGEAVAAEKARLKRMKKSAE